MKNRGVIFGLIAYFIFVCNIFAKKDFTLVIDPGHGGKDTGCVHNGGKEKDINLRVGLMLGDYIKQNHPNVKVLFTRSTDVFIGLQQRADFANKYKADLFISIHVNSAPSGKARGTETYVLGLAKQENNLSVAMRENKAMLLEGDYKTRYKGFDPSSAESYIMFQVMQDAYFNRSIDFANEVQKQYSSAGRHNRGVRQDILWVLSQSAMPSVLTELGFLSNKEEASFLLSTSGQRKLAHAIGNAFSKYYSRYVNYNSLNTSSSLSFDEDKDDSEQVNISDDGTTQVSYKIKFMCVTQKFNTTDRRFNRLNSKISRRKHGRYYIYYAGEYDSKQEALKHLGPIKKFYKDAIVVKTP